MRKRHINNPKRRIHKSGQLDVELRAKLLRGARYLGSAHHKRHAADYPFAPPVALRLNKSVCDDQRIIIWAEAKELFRIAIERGMVSQYCIGAFGFPKFVWAVDQNGEAYEAKQGGDGRTYHGYRLNNRDQAMRYEVCREWRLRC